LLRGTRARIISGDVLSRKDERPMFSIETYLEMNRQAHRAAELREKARAYDSRGESSLALHFYRRADEAEHRAHVAYVELSIPEHTPPSTSPRLTNKCALCQGVITDRGTRCTVGCPADASTREGASHRARWPKGVDHG